ncbi:hypothetical protein GCM10027168_41570 [Streptomyces capparidis]
MSEPHRPAPPPRLPDWDALAERAVAGAVHRAGRALLAQTAGVAVLAPAALAVLGFGSDARHGTPDEPPPPDTAPPRPGRLPGRAGGGRGRSEPRAAEWRPTPTGATRPASHGVRQLVPDLDLGQVAVPAVHVAHADHAVPGAAAAA